MSEVLEYDGWKENAIGEKFAADGAYLPFRGNTLICQLDQGSEIVSVISEMVEAMKAEGLARCYTFLPSASYHMTVFNSANDRARYLPAWPADLSLDAPMSACDRLFAQKLTDFSVTEFPVKMRIGAVVLKRGVSISLAPMNQAEETKIRGLRDRLSHVLRCRRHNHDVYEFHISVSYLINPPVAEECRLLQRLRAVYLEKLMRVSPIIELNAPAFCVFEDMAEYRPVFRFSSSIQ